MTDPARARTTGGLSVAVDVVVIALAGGQAEPDAPVVLLRRATGDTWALPGDCLGMDEHLEDAVARVLASVSGLPACRHLEQLASFGQADRDPRGRVVSVSYLGLLPRSADVADAAWWPATDPPVLALDHAAILATALDRLRGKLSYSNVAYGLLPDRFTLTELQAAYEAVLGHALDKRNFRKKVLSLRMLDETGEQRRGSHRPAQLYRFATRDLVLLDDVIPT
jgi:8-oxo-dGTP diphosphatase